MAEYIGRAAALEECDWYANEFSECEYAIMPLRMALEILPAADVRPVVLCRDCKWYQIDELKKDGTEDKRYKPSVCVLAKQRREPNHFCADGERRKKEAAEEGE